MIPTVNPKGAVIGLAGHVDHGKTSLIEALCNMTVARPHERAMGMTQDLGFAHFEGTDGRRIGVVDVPGHERYLHNMVAGTWKLDLLLLVVAANEGWMPMTSEHLKVALAMGCPRVVLCLTKCDLVDSTALSLLEERLLERLMEEHGIVPESIAVSVHRGKGLASLKQLLSESLKDMDTQPSNEHTRLYLDRVFSVNGVGTVVTGTLAGGTLTLGQTVELYPSGQRAKIRSLQCYHQPVTQLEASCRAAVALKGVKRDQLRRGDCLIPLGQGGRVAEQVIVRLNDEQPKLPRRATEVEVAVGTWHGLAKLVYIRDTKLARLRFSAPVPVFYGQRLALLRHGGAQLVHAAQIVWVDAIAPHYRKSLYALLVQNEQPFTAATEGLLALQLYGHIEKTRLTAEVGHPVVEWGEYVFLRSWLTTQSQRVLALLEPPGAALTASEMAAQLFLSLSTMQALLQVLKEGQQVAFRLERWVKGGGISEDDLSDQEQTLLAYIRQRQTQGLDLSAAEAGNLRKPIRNLVRLGLVVVMDRTIAYERQLYERLAGDILHQVAIGSRIDMAHIKLRSGLSRKYAIPLINRMEADGYVRRNDNDRVVLRLPDFSAL
ncbi:selenocysteine-specific translation elongation factor [Ferrimonas balearica]|uniref:selenocysteine-specific translation elongation factor n=1 Tax=Ferrimonas balearica TaxID=44012 RepID=UPI001C96F188|nr:selenocysteine-specific translation elongation factor [Ferrimonas balearica]